MSLQDGTPKNSAKLAPPERRVRLSIVIGCNRRIVIRVGLHNRPRQPRKGRILGVPEETEHAATILIRTGTSYHVDRAAGADPDGRIAVIDADLKLLHDLIGEIHSCAAAAQQL